MNLLALEGDASSKLKLPRIVRGGGGASRGVEEIYIQSVVLVNQVEHVRSQLESDLVREGEGASEADVGEDGIGDHSCVASQIAGIIAARRTCCCGCIDVARQIKGSRRRVLREHRQSTAAGRSAAGS